MRRLLALALAWVALVGATPLPLAPPLPDLTGLVPWVAAPLDKPSVPVPYPPLPPAPLDVPGLPGVPLMVPPVPKPVAPMPPLRSWPSPCLGAWLRIASESLECGRARFARGEDDEAVRALEQAVRVSGDPDILVEARYWLAESLYRLGRLVEADAHFRHVAADRGYVEFAVWGLHGTGWTALRLGEPQRAHEAFGRLVNSTLPPPLDTWSRHGLALALYALGRLNDAEKVWADLARRRLPVGLERDVAFWRGEILGRTGHLPEAVQAFARFAQSGPHALRATALVRQGWWSLELGKAAEAAGAFRAAVAETLRPSIGQRGAVEREWAQAGLALALAAASDWSGAVSAVRDLDVRRSVLAVPVRMRLAAAAAKQGQAAAAVELTQDLLAGKLDPSVRAWVLLLKGEAHIAEGNRDEARTQFELARDIDRGSPIGHQAALRLAQTNFELREYRQAMQELAALTSSAVPASIRASALVLQGEAAYHADDYEAAAEAYRRLIVEFPGDPRLSGVRLALGWAALRDGRRDQARVRFLEFARAHPRDPHAADALILASELTLAAGALQPARELLEQIIAEHPGHPRTHFARLNHGILLARTGQPGPAARQLRDWIARKPFLPLLGRAWVALGASLLAEGRVADAGRAFESARKEGVGDLASLGLGLVALAEKRLDDASRALTEARNTGTAEVSQAAEYGLVVTALQRGDTRTFRQAGQAALDAAPRGPMAAGLLYALAAASAEEKDWPAAMGFARRLVAEYSDHQAADDALARVGGAAASAEAWPVAYEAYGLLAQRYPTSPFIAASRLTFAQAQLEQGRPDEARRTLEEFVVAAPGDPRAAEAWMTLAKLRESGGDRSAALEAYRRAAQYGQSGWTSETRLTYARLLGEARRWTEARAALEPVLRQPDPALAAEAAAGMADAFAAQGDRPAAVEYYLTAAYLAPESPAGRRALLEAGRNLAMQRQPDSAAIVFRKLLEQSGVPGELADAARRELAGLKP